MKKVITCFWILMLLPVFVVAQENGAKDIYQRQCEFDDFKKQRSERFQIFKDSLNKEFSRMLEKRWIDYQVFVGKRRPLKPGPDQLPVAPKDSADKESFELPIHKVVPIEEEKNDSIEGNQEGVQNMQKKKQLSLQYKNVDVNFYMETIKFDFPMNYESLSLEDLSEQSVADFWAELAKCDYEESVCQLMKQKQEMCLNDWALYDLTKTMASEFFLNRYAEQTVLTVFMLNQLGYEAKIGRVENQLVVLMPFQTVVYAVSYVLQEDVPYYIFSSYPQEPKDFSVVTTYSVDFSSSNIPLDMNIYKPIRFAWHSSGVSYSSDFWGNTVPFSINQNAMDFYKNYPQVDITLYANAEMSEEFQIWVDEQIKPCLDGLDEFDAVNLLLYFVQTEFEYMSDFDQFGYEKPFFCEENFYYAKNDCEDRAVLFSYLVRNLINAKIALLDYPDHIATAVHLDDDNIEGDYCMVGGQKYFVCDPTYIGATVGETMPKYRKIKADVLMLK